VNPLPTLVRPQGGEPLSLSGGKSSTQIIADIETFAEALDLRTSGHIINVKADYGAVGNGTTNDATALQNAINAVPAGGGIVFFPQGSYRTNVGLTVAQSSVTFMGVGWDSNNIVLGSAIKTGAAMTDLLNVTGAGFRFVNMSLQSGGNATNCLTVSGRSPRILDAWFRQPTATAINIQTGASQAHIRGVRIENVNQAASVGILINDADCVISGTSVTTCETGIKILTAGTGAQIVGGCQIAAGTTVGMNNIWVSGSPSNITISDCQLRDVKLGSPIQLDITATCKNYIISDNVIQAVNINDNLYAGIGIDTTTTTAKGMKFSDNIIVSGASNKRLTYGLSAQTRGGGVAANPNLISGLGTSFVGNTIYATNTGFGNSGTPLISRDNIYTANETSYVAMAEV